VLDKYHSHLRFLSLWSCGEGNFAKGDVRKKKLLYSSFKAFINRLRRESAKGNEKLCLQRDFGSSDLSISLILLVLLEYMLEQLWEGSTVMIMMMMMMMIK